MFYTEKEQRTNKANTISFDIAPIHFHTSNSDFNLNHIYYNGTLYRVFSHHSSKITHLKIEKISQRYTLLKNNKTTGFDH